MTPNDLGDDILDQIVYRGEGNSSIVVALKSRTKVIRLWVTKNDKLVMSNQDNILVKHPARSINFIHLIMRPLTEPFLSGTTELIHLKSDFIDRLSKRVQACRPSHRLKKTLLLDDQYALFMDDLCALPTQLTRKLQADDLCGPTISVEIKPKQGFLPVHKSVMRSTTNDRSAAKLRNCCIYGSNQLLKLARGSISQTSDYCPINLFSGCPIKMKCALEELVRNPQNNLRVFKDLALAYGENNPVKLNNIFENFFEINEDEISSRPNHLNNKPQIGNEERFIELLIQCLLNEHDDKDSEFTADNENSFNHSNDICLQHIPKTKCRRCDNHPSSKKHKLEFTKSNHQLPKYCVLSSVLRAQKLDTIGAHDALYMLEWLLENNSKRTDNEGMNILEELSKPQMPIGFGSSHQLPQETKEQYYFRKVWEFLVSLTAKDCSIIMTIRRISSGRYESIVDSRPEIRNHLLKDHRSGSYYLFNVGIADLDQKVPLKIPRICDNLNLILQTQKSDLGWDPTRLQMIKGQCCKGEINGCPSP